MSPQSSEADEIYNTAITSFSYGRLRVLIGNGQENMIVTEVS